MEKTNPNHALKPAAAGVPQDWPRLAEHLRRHDLTLDIGDPPRQFASGFGNLNYLLTIDGAPAVLRRPPLGPIPPGANDMARESRILERLWQAYPLAPRCLHASLDDSVLGAPFFIMEYRAGLVIGGSFSAAYDAWRGEDGAPVGIVIASSLIDALVALHGVDPVDVDLDTLGKPEGFLARTRAGWATRADLAWGGAPPPVLGELLDWLDAHPVEEGAPTLLHNDFKLDNVILDPATFNPVAVIDWDMGTRGDPLYDLAVLLSYWTEAGDPPVMHQLAQMPSAGHGFPSREAVASAYAVRRGRPLTEFAVYRVLAILRLAVVFMQLNRRYREGGSDDARFGAFGDLANGLLEFARDVAKERYF